MEKCYLLCLDIILVKVWSKSRSLHQSILKILKLWMNEWCIYIALYCILLYTKSALQSCWGGGSLLNHHQCGSIHLDDATAATGQRHQCATGGEERRVIEPIKCMRSPHTSYRWRGERVIEPIKWDALATHQQQEERRESQEPIKWCARHTPATVERRES